MSHTEFLWRLNSTTNFHRGCEAERPWGTIKMELEEILKLNAPQKNKSSLKRERKTIKGYIVDKIDERPKPRQEEISDDFFVKRHTNIVLKLVPCTNSRASLRNEKHSPYFSPKILPKNYICHTCFVPGHFRENCPLNNLHNKQRIVKPTGIPKSFLRKIDTKDPELQNSFFENGEQYVIKK